MLVTMNVAVSLVDIWSISRHTPRHMSQPFNNLAWQPPLDITTPPLQKFIKTLSRNEQNNLFRDDVTMLSVTDSITLQNITSDNLD